MSLEHTRAERADRLNPARIHDFDLKLVTRDLWKEPELQEPGRHMGTTLVKTPALRVVLQAMRRGARLSPHRAPGPITVQVLEGELRFEAGDDVVYLRAGELLALPTRETHAVEAVRDSVFLLTISVEPE